MNRTISATIDEDLIRWVNSELKDTDRYRNKSHLIEIALKTFREKKR
jgi:Arc/MetJ-type ribon-helix-helix transcriptional regulator